MGNPEIEIAEQFALRTNQTFFLTGKAGTGKTTLLKKIADKTSKNYVIVAPTGVAAINAGGVTIHSMFQFPLTAFIPSDDNVDVNVAANRRVLRSHFRHSTQRKRLIQELELLIIDEISMVRCDILDAIDFTLRSIRKNNEHFGGVQVMVIGDMHQLPPVIRDNEWEILSRYYESPYFFDSHVWQQCDAAHIELSKIYRQQDEIFVNILNNIRHKKIMHDDYRHLEKRYNPTFKPAESGYVLLTTHNRIADNINETELRKLPATVHTFEAEVEGDFPDSMFPCDRIIRLKAGAQVMFIKNDVEGKRYYNGKLATVKKIEGGNITVTFSGSEEDFTLHHETWENINYSVDAGTGKINKKELGKFSQYPLRLAWAITIHKSQGLTFDKVIIDAGQSFATGQVYVALSRCRSLEGIVLHSRISENVLFSDNKINLFSEQRNETDRLESLLITAKLKYATYLLKRLFTFNKLSERILEWKEMIIEKDIPNKVKAMELCEAIRTGNENIIAVASKFENQLNGLLIAFQSEENNLQALKERCTKAIEYFTKDIFNKLITPLHEHVQSLAYKSKVKKYLLHVQSVEDNFWHTINQLYNASIGEEKLFTGEVRYSKSSLKKIESSVTTIKTEKGGTYKDTLELHRQKKTTEEIAKIRSLSVSTIKGHYAILIKNGDLNIFDVMSKDKIEKLEKYVLNADKDGLAVVKSMVGNSFDYDEIKMVANYVNRSKRVNY